MGTHPIFESDFDCLTDMDDRNVVLANFQACTAIDDYSVCLAILEQHNWDLQNAVNAALTQSASESTPPPSTPPVAPRAATLAFEVTSGGTAKTINFDESGTVGTLLQVIASEFDIWGGDSLQLSGWPNGAQPDPEIPLNLLDLPPTTKLRHQAAASPITSRWDDTLPEVAISATTITATSSTSSSNPFQALASSSSTADPSRKYAHFTLKIHDIDNDDHHELKYPGVKKVRDIKNDVYSLTLIPVSRQVWRGWPANVGDEKCLHELDTGAEHSLQLKVDDNRPRALPSSSQTAVDLNQARIDDNSDEEEEEDEADDYGDDDDFPIEEMSTQPKSQGKVPLITDYSGDYSVGTMQFMQEFQLRFGEQTPIWYIGTMEDAAKEAYGSATKAMERKMLAVYIHNERSIQSNIFCAQILCAPSINTFLMDNCIVWGFDVTNLNNKQLIYSQIERMYGGRVAGQVKRMSDDEYPLIIVSHGKGSSHDVSDLIMGNCNVDQVMTKLIVAKDQADVRRGDEHKAEMVREERVAEISNQESEYETSLRADREKMRLEQEEKRKKEDQAEQKRCEEESARLHQAEMGEQLPPEPPTGKDVSTLRFRFPDGSMKSRRFKQTARLSVLFIYIGAEGFAESQHKLVRPMPRLDLSAADRTKSLAQLGLKQDQLIVESINEESDESDDSDDSMEE